MKNPEMCFYCVTLLHAEGEHADAHEHACTRQGESQVYLLLHNTSTFYAFY